MPARVDELIAPLYFVVTDKNQSDGDTQMQGENTTAVLGAGIGVAAVIIIIAVIVAVIMLFKRRRDQSK